MENRTGLDEDRHSKGMLNLLDQDPNSRRGNLIREVLARTEMMRSIENSYGISKEMNSGTG